MNDSVVDTKLPKETYRKAFSDAYQAAMDDFREYHYWSGIKKLGNPIGKVMVEKVYRPFLSIEDILHDNKLNPRQKGFDMALKIIGGLAFVPVVLGAIIGGSALIAPMMFLCSSIETVKNFAFWRAERAERNLLRREMIKLAEIEKAINGSNLSQQEKTILTNYALKEAKIYTALYALREGVIKDSTQTFEQKKAQISALNSAIELFSKGELKAEYITDIATTFSLESQAVLLNDIQAYNQACEQIKNKQINVKKSLLDTIDLYKMARAEIHSQNLPDTIKSKMVEMIERDKNTIDNARDLEVRLVNHFINIGHLQKNSSSEIEVYDSPQIQKIDERWHILDSAKAKLKATLAKYAPTTTEKQDKQEIQEHATIQTFKKHGFNIKVVEDKMRLEHLEKATPKRLVNAVLTAGAAFIHGILVFAIPAAVVASGPAAPASAGALTGFLSVLSLALGVTSYGSAIVINRQDSKRTEALSAIKKSGEEASYEMSNEEVNAYKESLTNKKESKMTVLSHRVQAYLPQKFKSSHETKPKNPEGVTIVSSDKNDANLHKPKTKKH